MTATLSALPPAEREPAERTIRSTLGGHFLSPNPDGALLEVDYDAVYDLAAACYIAGFERGRADADQEIRAMAAERDQPQKPWRS